MSPACVPLLRYAGLHEPVVAVVAQVQDLPATVVGVDEVQEAVVQDVLLGPGGVERERQDLASLDRYTDEPILDARLTMRRGPGRSRGRYVVDARVLFGPVGEPARVLAAHVAAPGPAQATDEAVERLRRQLRRVVDAEVAERNEPDEIQKALETLPLERTHRPEADAKPPEERQIVRRRTYSDHPEATLEAAADMFDLDEEFHLFVHVRTNEDVVVHRLDDRRIGLIHPRGSILADESDDIVVAEPNRYSDPRSSRAVDRVELMQEGVVGLLSALERFEPARGTPFWAYASWWVRQAMQQLVSELTRPVVLSDRALRQLARVKDARREYLQAYSCDPSSADLAERTGLTRDQIDNLLAVERAPRGLEEPVGDDDGTDAMFGELIADPVAEDAYERVDRRLEVEELPDLVRELCEREQTILRARFGLDGRPQTLREVAGRLGLSAERVRQIEERALEKLRAAASPEATVEQRLAA
jgi:RNA polymerase sigma factor (sigma-70 family)